MRYAASATRTCAGRVDLTVVNAADHPALVKKDNILALPTLVKHTPGPLRHLVGNLTDLARVRDGSRPGPCAPVDPVTPSRRGDAMTSPGRLADSSEAGPRPSCVEQIAYLQEALAAISSGGVDAVVLGSPENEQVYTLTNADRPYRVIVERMGEGAATVSERGVILFANPRLAQFLGIERDSMIGRDLTTYVDAGAAGRSHVPARDRGDRDAAGRAHARGTRRQRRPGAGRGHGHRPRRSARPVPGLHGPDDAEARRAPGGRGRRTGRAAAGRARGQRHHRAGSRDRGDGSRPRALRGRPTSDRQHVAQGPALDRRAGRRPPGPARHGRARRPRQIRARETHDGQPQGAGRRRLRRPARP